MKLPPRLVLPVVLALLCAGIFLVFLWWQLVQSTEMLRTSVGSGAMVTDLEAPQQIAENPIDPRDRALLHLRQGDLLALRGEWAEAEQEYQKAVDEDGGLPALRKLAQAQLQRRDTAGVRDTIRSMKNKGAKSEDILLLESIVELRTGELVKARDLLANAADSPQKHYGLALLSIIEGNHEIAKTELALVINGWEPVLRSYARTIQAAYDEFTLFPESKEIHLITLLSRALAQVQECELALPLLVQVTQAQDDYRDAWIVQGYCELTTERFKEALASLERAYSLDPEKPEIQYFLARTYAALSDHSNAVTFFEYAIVNGFQPESEARRWIAQSALAQGNATLALEQYEILTQKEDATLEPYEGYVATAIALDQKEEAYTVALEAVKRFPQEGAAYDLLGWAALETDRKDEARDALQKALQIDPYLTSAKERLREI